MYIQKLTEQTLLFSLQSSRITVAYSIPTVDISRGGKVYAIRRRYYPSVLYSALGPFIIRRLRIIAMVVQEIVYLYTVLSIKSDKKIPHKLYNEIYGDKMAQG